MSWQLTFWATLSLGFCVALCLWPFLPRQVPGEMRLRAFSVPLTVSALIGVSILFRDAPSVTLAFVSLLPLLSATELLRKVKAAQYVAAHPNEVCPANWEEGNETLSPSLDLVGKI